MSQATVEELMEELYALEKAVNSLKVAVLFWMAKK